MISTAASVCGQILKLDASIRFAGISTWDGEVIAAEYREGITPLLTSLEFKTSLIQSLIRMSTRMTLENKLGNVIYSFTEYEYVKRLTIPLCSASSERHDNILMISFDKAADHNRIIEDKIKPLLRTIQSIR